MQSYSPSLFSTILLSLFPSQSFILLILSSPSIFFLPLPSTVCAFTPLILLWPLASCSIPLPNSFSLSYELKPDLMGWKRAARSSCIQLSLLSVPLLTPAIYRVSCKKVFFLSLIFVSPSLLLFASPFAVRFCNVTSRVPVLDNFKRCIAVRSISSRSIRVVNRNPFKLFHLFLLLYRFVITHISLLVHELHVIYFLN